jgi:hypothetical protein
MRSRKEHGSDELTGAGILLLMSTSHDEPSGADFFHHGKRWGKDVSRMRTFLESMGKQLPYAP